MTRAIFILFFLAMVGMMLGVPFLLPAVAYFGK